MQIFDDKEVAEIALTQYEARRTEVAFYQEKFHSRIGMVEIFFTIFIGASALVASSDKAAEWATTAVNSQYVSQIMLSLYLAITSFKYLMFSSIMDAFFMLRANAVGCEVIEEQLNDYAKRPVLNWELTLAPILNSARPPGYGLHPGLLVIVWLVAVVLLTSLFVVGLLFITPNIPAWVPWLCLSVEVILLIFHFLQMLKLTGNAFDKLRVRIKEALPAIWISSSHHGASQE